MALATFTNLKDWQYDVAPLVKTLKQTPVAVASIATNLLTSNAHGLTLNMPVIISASVMPTGLTAGTIYYARDITANSFGLAATAGGAQLPVSGGTTILWSARRSVQALYSEIQNEFDELGQLDDTVPMKYNTPVEYEFINGWDFDLPASSGYLYGGSIKVNKTDSIWANFYTLGTIEADAVVYWYQNGALVATHVGYTTGHIDQLILVRSSGADISTDGIAKGVVAFIRNNASGNADLYDNFSGLATDTGGRNPVPVATSPDANDTGGGATYAAVTLTFGVASFDIGDGAGAQAYSVSIDGGGLTCAQVYEALKYRTRAASVVAMTTIGQGAVNGQFYRAANTAYSPVKSAPFGSFAGGKIFGARGIWIANVSDPANRALLDNANVSRTPPVSVSVAINSVVSGDRCFMARSAFQSCTGATNAGSLEFTSTAHGLSVDTIVQFTATTLPANISALTNYYVISAGLAANTYRVSATQGGTAVAFGTAGTAVVWQAPLMAWKKQFTIASRTTNTIVVNEACGVDIPSTGGVIRVGDNKYAYTSRTGSSFAGVSPSPAAEAISAACYVPIIDEQAAGTSITKSLVYAAPFDVVGRVRKYGAGAGNSILPFENSGTVGTTGLTMSAIRTVDTVAT